MIALNEIVSNQTQMEQTYMKMGYKIDLTPFVVLENKRKAVQIEAEGKRAETSKRCAAIADLKNQNKSMENEMQEILSLDREAKVLKARLDRLGAKIDRKLLKLPNVALLDNAQDEVICTGGVKTTDLGSVIGFLSQNFKLNQCRQTISKQIACLKNRIFSESELGIAYVCRDGIALLLQNDLSDIFTKTFIEFLMQNSAQLVQISIKHLPKISAAQFVATLNERQKLQIDFIGEFLTRQYKIKYHNQKLDSTKFVYQINIKQIG